MWRWVALMDTPSHAIVGGQIEEGYPAAVGLYEAETLGAEPDLICSGNLITPRLVLSSAACYQDRDATLTFAAFGDGVEIEIVEAVFHPDYERLTGVSLGENNVSLLELAEDAPVEPVWIRTERIKPADHVGEEAVGVGWGEDENDLMLKRSATFRIDEIDSMFLVSYGASNENNANACNGDGGGPLYREEDGTLLQWGIHSWMSSDCAYYSGWTRADKVSDWILEQVERVHGTTDLCEISGIGCPEPDLEPEPEPQAEETPEGCGCSGAPTTLSPLVLAFLLLLRKTR